MIYSLSGKLVHTEDRNDILQLFILLQNLLYASGYTIMLLTDDSGIQNAGGRLQRINRRINTQLYNGVTVESS